MYTNELSNSSVKWETSTTTPASGESFVRSKEEGRNC